MKMRRAARHVRRFSDGREMRSRAGAMATELGLLPVTPYLCTYQIVVRKVEKSQRLKVPELQRQSVCGASKTTIAQKQDCPGG